MKKILGVDEAGRGAVIGPLIICGYLISEDKLKILKEWKVKDSKLLTPGKRELLSKKLRKLADDLFIIRISAQDIDESLEKSNLNKMEIEKMQTIINKLKPDKAYIDSVEANTEKFCDKIKAKISEELKEKIEYICENFADRKYPIVGAASIIAKVERDMEIEWLKKKYGDFGSGYPSDPKTVKFLKDWFEKNKVFPHVVRKSWSTVKEMKREVKKRTLKDFIK